MKNKFKKTIYSRSKLAIVIFALIAFPNALAKASEGIDDGPPERARVQAVLSGEKLVLDSGHVIQYAGLRVPDTVQEVRCFGREALMGSENLVGAEVRLEKEPLLQRSSDGAWFRYVFKITGEGDDDEYMVNERMVEGGFAFPHAMETMLYGKRFIAGANYSRATGKGLWSRCEVAEESGLLKTQLEHECIIKGVRNKLGNKVFYMQNHPGYPYPAVLKNRGDEWLCSEEAAEEAGYERAKVDDYAE